MQTGQDQNYLTNCHYCRTPINCQADSYFLILQQSFNSAAYRLPYPQGWTPVGRSCNKCACECGHPLNIPFRPTR